MQVIPHRSTRGLAQVEADVDGMRIGHHLKHPDGGLDKQHQLRGLPRGEILQVAFLPERHHHHVPSIIGVQVEHAVHQLTPGHDETILIRHLRHLEERIPLHRISFCAGCIAAARMCLDVAHPVGGPDALEAIRGAHTAVQVDPVLGAACGVSGVLRARVVVT